jgi:hypothetical protein
MGRNSVEATKASLIRAVRTRRAALTLGLADLLAVGCDLVAVLPVGAGLVAVGEGFSAVDGAGAAGAAAVPPLGDCPATGDTVISKESSPAMKRAARRATGVGEDENLISSL